MNRKIRFKQRRIYNLKIFVVSIVFIGVIFFGLLAVDMNKNYMLYGQEHLDLFKIKSIDGDKYSISVLNNEFSLNLKYIKRDINNLKSFFYK